MTMDHPLPPSIWAWCPDERECRAVAEVVGETVIESTSGDVCHVWTVCCAGHRYFLPLELVVLMV